MAKRKQQDHWTFGALVRRERMAKKIGLREMARKIGVSPTYLSMIERGENAPPTEAKVREIAKLIGLNEDKLLELADRTPDDVVGMIKDRELWQMLRDYKVFEAKDSAALPGQYARLLSSIFTKEDYRFYYEPGFELVPSETVAEPSQGWEAIMKIIRKS